MKRLSRNLVLIAGLLAVPAAALQPSDADCRAQATQATGYSPENAPPPPQGAVPGARVAGAARGAAAGAVVGGVQNERYDNAPDRVQDEHRENQARSGAAAGVAVAGSRNRQARRGARRAEASMADQQAAWNNSYNSCMQQGG